MRHRMTKHEYKQLRDALRTMRTENPQLTAEAALEKVNAKLAHKMSLPTFYSHFAAAKPKRNGRTVKKSDRNQVRTAVVHAPREFRVAKNAENIPATRNGHGASKIRLIMVEAEIGEADLDNIAHTLGLLLASPS